MAPYSRVREGRQSRWSIHHLLVFCLTFMGYAYFHATRKSFSNVKSIISEEWTPSFSNETINETLPNVLWNTRRLFADTKQASVFLGGLDTAFLLAYAVGLYISGFVGDRLDLRLVLTFGMCTSALSVFLFGVLSEILHVYSTAFYMVFWILNGLLQSTGWPAMVAIMGNWFGRSSRGFVLGAWSACASVGNIIGALVSSGVIDSGYQYAFLVPASMLFGGGIITYFSLVPHPKELGLPGPDEEEVDNPQNEVEREALLGQEETIDSPEDGHVDSRHETEVVPSKRPAVGFLQAVMIRGVIPYSLSYACLKLVNYAFFFWLPFYLTSKYGWKDSAADEISIWYDVGGIIGGIVGGFISDRLQLRASVVTVMLIGAFPAIYGYSVSPNDKTINSVLMGVTGFWIGGPANLISSAIAADLGKDGSVAGNREALATVTGIVDGTGSVGGALGQILIPLIENKYGWQFVFYLFMLMIGLTVVCIVPMQMGEIKSLTCYQRRWGSLRPAPTQPSNIQEEPALVEPL